VGSAVAATAGALGVTAFAGGARVRGANGDPVIAGQQTSGTAITIVRNTAAATDAVAFRAIVTTNGPGGATAGVWGQSNAQNGAGVFGVAAAGASKGVWGRSVSGRGVYGEATGTSGVNWGVVGESKAPLGTGVHGKGGYHGILGEGVVGVRGHGSHLGVVGSGDTAGVYGEGDPAIVGIGEGSLATGIRGSGTYGVAGYGTSFGVWGEGRFGVQAVGTQTGLVGTGPTGVYGSTASGHAGYFNGRVHIQGTLSKTGGTFLIDHPQDPENRTLEHSFVEAPERLNVYSGTVTLDARGRATVRMPRYFRALNADYRYQLTAIGAPAPSLHVAREITRTSFAIAGGAPGQRVCWMVTGVRQDAWAKHNPIRVERTKKAKDRGKYLNPEAFGKSKRAAMHPVPKAGRGPRPFRPPRLAA
jgi:hypothetical protein